MDRCALIAVALLVAWGLSAHGQPTASPKHLPGTKPLSMEQPLDEIMVAGISRFALRTIKESPDRQAQHWDRDYRDAEAYSNSVEANRSRLRTIIGAVDRRETSDQIELLATLDHDAVVAHSDDVVFQAVRWRVLPGVAAEGLLVEPRKPPLARVVALPDAEWTTATAPTDEDGDRRQLAVVD